MPNASQPVLAVNPSDLRWQNDAELNRHFHDHAGDKGNCLQLSLGSHPCTEKGYMQKQEETVRDCQFLLLALIRNRKYPDPKHKKRMWAFAPNLFCVGMALRTHKVVTAYHNHLEYGQHGHKLFEQMWPTDKQKEDAFLDWLATGVAVATSAKVMLGSTVSHEITEVERLWGFPEGE